VLSESGLTVFEQIVLPTLRLVAKRVDICS